MHPWLTKAVDTVNGHPKATRWVLAGPGALIVATLFMAAMPVWLPSGTAGVDNIVYPLVLAPLLWTAVFLYACLEENLGRGAAAMSAAILLQGAIVVLAFV
ncbi:hypothetical protein [Hwanghaeella sp.]|uniref:hypothetical protein n=1 Tax=Hwanghaeella sp. TaxID=2605943 RepID=UPI003CCB9210